MRRFQIPVLLTALLLVAPSLARAQAKGGDKEVQVQGNVISLMQPGSTNTSGSIIFGFGYFMSDRSQFLVSPTITISQDKGSVEIDPFTGRVLTGAGSGVTADLGLGAGYRLFFGAQSSKVKPYVGGDINIQSFKTDSGGSIADKTFLQAIGGVKNYLTERAALDFNARFGSSLKNSDFGLFMFTVGITYLF